MLPAQVVLVTVGCPHVRRHIKNARAKVRANILEGDPSQRVLQIWCCHDHPVAPGRTHPYLPVGGRKNLAKVNSIGRSNRPPRPWQTIGKSKARRDVVAVAGKRNGVEVVHFSGTRTRFITNASIDGKIWHHLPDIADVYQNAPATKAAVRVSERLCISARST